MKPKNMDTGEIIVYQPDEMTRLEVRVEGETVWLNRHQLAVLFGRDVKTIGKHIKNALMEELADMAVVAKFATTAADGKVYSVEYYNLDMILSVGYRVKSSRGVQFRRTSLPPVEGIFYDGQIFDAYVFVSDLVKSAKTRLVLIDNYVDESVFILLSKRNAGVNAEIRTGHLSRRLQLDIQKHNSQYPPIKVVRIQNVHDRFMIIDDDNYHIRASLKDLGKKLFAFSKMGLPPECII